MSWPSSFRTASGACIRRWKIASTTSPSTTKTTRSRRCRKRDREDIREGILQRHLQISRRRPRAPPQVQLFGSGSILNEALRAQQILAERYQIAADVWSVTSYNELRREALGVERWNRLHPSEEPKTPYIVKVLEGSTGPIIAASGLHEGGAGSARAVAAWAAEFARHRRIRAQRESRASAATSSRFRRKRSRRRRSRHWRAAERSTRSGRKWRSRSWGSIRRSAIRPTREGERVVLRIPALASGP